MKFMLKSKEDVWQAIRHRGREIAKTLSDEAIFTSAEFFTYASKLADFILRNHKVYGIKFVHDNRPNASTGCTDGKMIHVNTGAQFISHVKLLERRFKAVMGILFHECGHKLFCDFDTFAKIMDTLRSGKLYGRFPDNLPPNMDAALGELKDAMSSGYSKGITALYARLSNCIDDGHDEAVMKRCFPGFIADCITVTGETLIEEFPSLSQMIAENKSAYSIFDLLILEYAKHGYYKVGESTPEAEKYLSDMQQIEPVIDAALLFDDYAQRWDMVNQLMLFLWPTVRDRFQQKPADDENSEQSSPENLEAEFSSMQCSPNVSPAPQNCTGSGISPQKVGSPMSGSGGGLDEIMQEISEKAARDEVQKALDNAEMEAIKNCKLPMVHAKVPLSIKRHFKGDKAEYERIYGEVEPVLRNLISEMRNLLREHNEECVQHHRRFGPMVEATEAYRVDNAFFAKKKLPDDLPDMAICLLIDRSGSMNGEKLDAAKRTAILVERFADALDIPIMVAAHDAHGSQVNIHIYSDYVSTMTEQDRYALAAMESGGCNRDGLPLWVCADLLSQRPEKIKLMIVISDGLPYHNGYEGDTALTDITSTVGFYRRRGVLIYGAAIDGDRDAIGKFYGRSFISIDNLSLLPKTLVRLIRQHII